MKEYMVQQRHKDRCKGEWVSGKEVVGGRTKVYSTYNEALIGLTKVKERWEKYNQRPDKDLPAFDEFRIIEREVSEWKAVEGISPN